MRKLTYLFLLPLIAACAGKPAEFRSVSAENFATIIEDTNVQRVDVRTGPEYLRGHIDGSMNIDVLKDSFEIKAVSTLDKTRPVAIYCRSGRRSKEASQKLADLGYTNIIEFGGILDWKGEIEK